VPYVPERGRVPLRRRSEGADPLAFPGFADLELIRAGEGSTLLRGREVATARIMALKVLEVPPPSVEVLQVFEHEVHPLGSRTSHPNIVEVLRVISTADGRPVMVMDVCRGSMADELGRRGRLGPRDTVALGVKLAGALESAHRSGVLHRDVKPRNVLLTSYGQPALADFGLAHLRATLRATVGVYGLYGEHTAPEVLEGAAPSPASDVYGLASTLYELLTGHPAFRSFEDEAPVSFILRIVRDPVAPITADGVPAPLSDLLLRALAKNPDIRPASARAFGAELQAVEVGRGWPETTLPLKEGFPLPLAPFTHAAVPSGNGGNGGQAPRRPEVAEVPPAPDVAPDPAAGPPAGTAAARPPGVVVPVPIKQREVVMRGAIAPTRGRPHPVLPPPLPRRRPPISSTPRPTVIDTSRTGDPFPRRDTATFGLTDGDPDEPAEEEPRRRRRPTD